MTLALIIIYKTLAASSLHCSFSHKAPNDMAEFIANKFGGSLGGCADGTPAFKGAAKQGRNGKSSVEQGETDLMVSFPGGRGSNIDRELTGARNVNLRTSDEGV